MSTETAVRIVMRCTAAMAATLSIVVSGIFVATPLAHAEDWATVEATVAFTQGPGAGLSASPSYADILEGAFVTDGAGFTAECWSSGDPVTNEASYTSDVWLRAPGSVYLPEAYAETGSYGVPPGLISCENKDYLLDLDVGAPYTYHQAGVGLVKYGDKLYVSKAETVKAYESMRDLNDISGSLFCNATGIAVGVIAGVYSTPVGGIIAMSAVETLAGDIFCNTAAGMTSTAAVEDELWPIVSSGSCAVLSGDLDGNSVWTTSNISSTTDPFYCA